MTGMACLEEVDAWLRRRGANTMLTGADAMRTLSNNGAGYTVVATQFEPSISHFDFVGPNGQGASEGQVKECLTIPPQPPVPSQPCRDNPRWVVAQSGRRFDVVIPINALTGRFGGGGTVGGSAPSTSGASDNCAISSDGGATPPCRWQPIWNQPGCAQQVR